MFDHVRAKFGTEDSVTTGKEAKGVVEPGRACPGTGGDGEWQLESEFDVHGVIPVACPKGACQRPARAAFASRICSNISIPLLANPVPPPKDYLITRLHCTL